MLSSWAACAALAGTWGVWSVMAYGLHGTTGSTTTVIEGTRNSWSGLAKNFGLNATYSIIPRTVWRFGATMKLLGSPEFFWSKWRDVIFLFYEPSLLLAWGAGGLVVMIWLLWNSRRSSERGFWIALVGWIYIGGLLACTPPSYYLGGVAHVILQPIVWIGLAWLAGNASRMPRWLMRIWWWGILFDATWLVLHLGLEGRIFQLTEVGGQAVPADMQAASTQTMTNQTVQLAHGLRFLGMETVGWEPLVLTLLLIGALAWWWGLRKSLTASRFPLARPIAR
jgi:hypothetical protein